MAGGSLADGGYSQELAALVKHVLSPSYVSSRRGTRTEWLTVAELH